MSLYTYSINVCINVYMYNVQQCYNASLMLFNKIIEQTIDKKDVVFLILK